MKNINLAPPSIGENEIKAAERVLRSGWVIRGQETQKFEAEFAKKLGAKYAIATNGCTMALYLVLKQLNLKEEDEVIVPSLTWSATASAVIQAGGKPVFADVKKDDWCLDPSDVRRKITNRTRLVIPVHFAARFAKGFEKFPVPVLYDSAHRIEPTTSLGVASCYSFYAVKNITTVRGGMILTNNQKLAENCLRDVHGGLTKDTLSRYSGDARNSASFYYEVEVPGWNFDMTDVEAAIGREQLKKLSILNKKRNQIVHAYNKALELNNTGNHLYPILVENRDEFLPKMKEVGIQCGIHYLPLHQMKGYKEFSKAELPVTEFIGEHCVSLPLNANLTKKEVIFIIESVKKYGKVLKKIQ